MDSVTSCDCVDWGEKWVQVMGVKCPECQSVNVSYNPTMVLTTYPEQFHFKCKDCEHTWTGHIPPASSQPYAPMYGRYGWICPKCNRALSPDTRECPCSLMNNNIVWTTPVSPSCENINCEKVK